MRASQYQYLYAAPMYVVKLLGLDDGHFAVRMSPYCLHLVALLTFDYAF